MLFTIAIVLAAASLFTEVKLVHSFPLLRKAYVHPKFGTWINTGMSFVLSWFTGALFGASGLTIALAGALSTAASQAFFTAESLYMRTGLNANSLRNRIQTNIANARRVYQDFEAIIRDLRKACSTFWRIISAPFRGLRWLAVKYAELRPSPQPQQVLTTGDPTS